MKKLSYVLLVLFLLLAISSPAVIGANYYTEISNIITETTSDMQSLMAIVQEISKGNKTMSEGATEAGIYRDRALSQLIRMIELNSKTGKDSFHARTVSLISDWYLVTGLLEQGLDNNDMDKINAGTQVMISFNQKANELTAQIE